MEGKDSRRDSLPSAGSLIAPQAVEQWELDSVSDSDSSDVDSSEGDGSGSSDGDANPEQGETRLQNSRQNTRIVRTSNSAPPSA